MEWLASLVPVTVVAAVALFALKEALEFFRRRSADKRKSHAFRTLLARECEVNHWAHWRLEVTLEEIQEDHESGVPAHYTVMELPGGGAHWKRIAPGDEYSSGGLPDVRTDLMSKIMIDVASLDRKLFMPLESAYDALIEMRHVRASLLRFVTSKEAEDQMHFEGFPEYGLRVLERAKEDLEALYLECTGRPLTNADRRVRG